MPSVYKRKLKSGEYWFGAVKTRDGQWKKFSTGHKTSDCSKPQAKFIIEKIQAEVYAGRDPLRSLTDDQSEERFAALTQRFIEERSGEWARTTQVSRADTFRKFCNAVGDLPVNEIGRDEVLKFKEWLMSNLGPHSVNIHLRNLRTFVNWRRGIAPDWKAPVVREVKAPGAVHVDHLSAEEMGGVLSVAAGVQLNGQPVAPFLGFLLGTGMRRGEGLSAEWEWIEGDFIRVPASRTKTNRKRFVPVIADVRRILTERPVPHSGRIFPEMTVEVTNLFREKICPQARIGRPMHLHNLRHTFIVFALRSGVPAFLVAEIVGNSERVIRDHYAHLAKNDLKAVASQLNAISFSTSFLP